MPRSLEELKKEFETLKKTDLYEDVIGLISEEQEKGKELHRKNNKENEKLRKHKIALEALGYDGTTELDEFVAEIIRKKDTSTDDSSRMTVKALNEKIDALIKENALTKQKAQEYQTKAKQKTISSELLKELSDKVYGPNILIKNLINDGQVDLDESDRVVFKIDGETLPLKDGIQKVLEANKEIVKNTQNGGAGTKGGSGMPSNIAEIMKSGSKEEIKQNLSEIKKTLGLE